MTCHRLKSKCTRSVLQHVFLKIGLGLSASLANPETGVWILFLLLTGYLVPLAGYGPSNFLLVTDYRMFLTCICHLVYSGLLYKIIILVSYESSCELPMEEARSKSSSENNSCGRNKDTDSGYCR